MAFLGSFSNHNFHYIIISWEEWKKETKFWDNRHFHVWKKRRKIGGIETHPRAELKIIGSKRDRKSLYGKPAIRNFLDGKLGQRKLENIEGGVSGFRTMPTNNNFPDFEKRCHFIFTMASRLNCKFPIQIRPWNFFPLR